MSRGAEFSRKKSGIYKRGLGARLRHLREIGKVMTGDRSGSSFDVGTAQHLEEKGSLNEDR
jgi:hypothetical protein